MKNLLRLDVLSLVLVAGCLAACGSPAKSRRALWDEKGPASYQYTLRWSCFCGPDFTDPMRITVRDGAITSAVDVETGMPVDPATRRPLTIEGLFDVIEDAYRKNAAKVDVTYDPTDGHPVSANIDYDQRVIDEELGFRTEDLQRQP